MPATAMVKVQSVGVDAIVAAEFDELPAMRLTMPQVCRLWSLSPREAEDVVRTLVGRGVLTLDPRGRVCRPENQAA